MPVDLLPLKTVRNPRDLGGYVGYAGRKIKKRRLLRTGTVAKLSQEDADFLRAYGVKTIIDLRSPQECVKRPDRLVDGIASVHIPISSRDQTQAGASFEDLADMYATKPLAGFRHMIGSYQKMVSRPHSQAAFHDLLAFLAQQETGGTIFHCSEGKDRTGMSTVFILYILGVDLETIRQDYLASGPLLNDYRARRDRECVERGDNLIFRANLRSLGTVNNEYLDAALLLIQEKYGDLDHFIVNQLGVGPGMQECLRDLYLE